MAPGALPFVLVGLAHAGTTLLPLESNLDAVGTGPAALVDRDAWEGLPAWVPRAPDAGLDALALKGPLRPDGPSSWKAGVDGRVGHLRLACFLAPGAAAPPATTIGYVRWEHADGGLIRVPLRQDEELPRLDAATHGGHTTLLPAGPGKAVGVLVLANPRPDTPVARVVVELVPNPPAGASLVLLGAAVSDDSPPVPIPPIRGARGFAFPMRPEAAARFAVPTDPAPGTRGFVGVRDGHLVFEDGGRARFWGVNLVGELTTPPPEAAPVLADQLAAAGVNLVRLHHADEPRVGLVRPGHPDGVLDPERLRRFDGLVAALEARGIHVVLEIATQRRFTAADGVGAPDGTAPNGHKILPRVEEDWWAAWERWTRAWIGRVNGVTQRRYADDPGVAMVELSNEDGLVANWLAGGLELLGAPHRAALDARWNAYLRARYPSDDALRAAWAGSAHPGLGPGETLGAIARAPVSRAAFAAWPRGRAEDLARFYDSLDAAFLARARTLVRELGFRVPVVGGVTFQQPVVAETLGAQGDVLDIHLEWDSPFARDDSLLSAPRAQDLLDRLLEAQAGHPFLVSELNHVAPNTWSAEAPLTWAVLASLQDWDGVAWFDYANGPWDPAPSGLEGPFALRDAGARWLQMPVASALFRSGVLNPAPGTWTLHRAPGTALTQLAARVAPRTPQVRDAAFVLSHRIRSAYGPTPPPPGIPGAPPEQVGWWVGPGLLYLDTPRVKAVVGRHDRRAEVGHGEGAGLTAVPCLDVRLDGFAAVSLVSLTDAPLTTSPPARLLVLGTMGNTGMTRAAGGTVVESWGHGPVLHARPAGTVRLTWSHRPEVRPVAPDGTLGAAVSVRADADGGWSLDLDGPTLAWEIR